MSSLETLFMNSKYSRTQRLDFLKEPRFETAQGFSLTEIMVALLISSILMYGVMTIMSSGKRTYALQTELAELYDNARFLMEDITFTLRMAGFKGCAGSSDGVQDPLGGKPDVGDETGKDNNQTIADTGDFPSAFPERLKKSDRLRVRSLDRPLKWYDEKAYGHDKLTQNDEFQFSSDELLPEVGAPLIVSDCKGWEYTKVKTVDKRIEQNGSETNVIPYIKVTSLNKVYEKPIDVYVLEEDPSNPGGNGKLKTVLYEVRWKPKSGNQGDFLLYRRTNVPNTYSPPPEEEEPFLEGVENLQVRYGIKSGNSITYQDATPTGGEETVSVRVTLLMRTSKPRFDIGEPPSKVFRLDSALIYNPFTEAKEFETGHRHRVFTATVAIRNNNLDNL